MCSRGCWEPILPAKSRICYDEEYKKFTMWCGQNHVTESCTEYIETALLAYFNMKSKVLKSSTLWASYSTLEIGIVWVGGRGPGHNQSKALNEVWLHFHHNWVLGCRPPIIRLGGLTQKSLNSSVLCCVTKKKKVKRHVGIIHRNNRI